MSFRKIWIDLFTLVAGSELNNNSPVFNETLPLSLTNTLMFRTVFIRSKFDFRKLATNDTLPIKVLKNLPSTLFSVLFLSCSFLLSYILTWYLNQITSPGFRTILTESKRIQTYYGFTRSPLFPFLPSYWFGQLWKRDKHFYREDFELERQKSKLVSNVRLLKLSKSIGKVGSKNENVILDDVSLNCEYGTVSVLLGSNHAGKSTIMDIISVNSRYPSVTLFNFNVYFKGSSNFTSGEGFLLGYDIKTEMNSVFPLMGVMSEQDIFYPNLTIAEHLEFYARFRSINLKSDIRELMKSKLSQPPLSKSRNLYRSYALAKLNQMQLSSFENSFVHQLSDGTKRQIQLLLATIGSERILLLDEPTTSMDELARRKTWNFIRNLKRGRVIILATRDPEEADALGDSVNMLKNGRLRASGTPLFLKNRFGSGYQLSVSIRPWQPIRRTSLHKGDSRFKATELRMKAGCASKEEIELFISYAMLYLPGAQVISSVGGAIVFSIPKWNTKYIMAFLKALRKDERLEWSMSNSTLEEVFSRICLSIEGQNRDVDTISISSARTKDAEEVDFGDFSVDPELRLSKKDIMEINVDASLGRKARSKSRSPSSSKRSRTPLGPVPSFTEFIYDSTYESDLAATVISQFEAIQTATRPISMLVPPPAEVEAPNNQKNIAFQQMNAMFYKNFLLWWKEPIVNIIWIIVIALTLLASSIIPKFAFAPSVSSFPGSTCQTYFQTNANSDGKTSPLLDGPGGSCNATKLAQLMSSPPQALTNATAQFVPACYAADKSGCLPQDFTGISSDMFPFRISEAAATRPSPLSPDLIENFSRDLYQTSASRPLVWYNEAPQMDVSFAKLINDSRVTSASGYQGAGIDSRNSFKFPPYFKQIGRDINSEFGDAQLRFANDAQDNIGRCQAQFNGIRGLYTQKDTFVNTYSNAYPTFGINYRKLDLASLKMSFDFVTYPVIRTPQISNLANIVYSDSDRTIPNLVKANSTCFAASPGNSVESNGVSEMKAAQILIHSISNALLKLKTNNAAASFSGQILRMPGFYTLLSERDLKLITILTMMFFIFGTSMFLPRLVNMISKEREDGLHLRLRAIGVKSLPIWMANYCFGLLIILILAAIFTTTLLLVSVEPFSAFLRKSDQGIVVLFALLLVFWCHIQICIALFIPACFTKRVNAVIFTIVMVLLTTVSPFLLLLSDPVTGEIPIIYTCIPQIAFISLINILTVSSRTSTLPVLVFTVQFCLLVLIPTILVVIGFYLTFIRKQLDWLNQYRYWFSKPTSNPRISSEPTDSDVETEAIDIKISKGAKDGFEVATIQNFTKAQNKKTILENISLSIGYGETLGVCAINDGGKSALLAAISGMIKPTSGNVTFDSTLTLGNVGISSYHDKIWPNLTVLEHLTLYCKLVGVSKIFISGRVRYIAEVVGLSREMLNIQAGNLNNGMLRQLSIGIALTSTPKVLLLDDPAVGLDIQTKRSIWRVIDRVKRERGRAVVLATNSLKEADSLCTRVGILKDGKLGALGTPYHLKAKFSDGIQLTLRFRIKCRLPEHGSPQRENDNHMLQYFSWAEMKRLGEIHDAITTHLSPKAVVEPHLDTDFHAVLMKCNFHRGGFKSKDVNDVSWKLMVRYLIPLEGADSVLIFSRLPAICEHLAISEWEFCVPTLEDVFVQVVR
ncbi:hypothetical protein HK098_007671 [Nowakowskiella sp. JEL0407]|nr:hypothetical protein HK098_007671 [Nowakowskiella sp. JEL0407]